MPSCVASACDPSGGMKVVGQDSGLARLAKAQGSWFLDEGAPREAGFTEQRSPLALDSGGITGCCSSSSYSLMSLAPEPSLFFIVTLPSFDSCSYDLLQMTQIETIAKLVLQRLCVMSESNIF
ncbi:hypothetical protein D0Y65_037615 [Glycine soja]|uniref:Uncharacterized protein n=1 Tax=Glycine soja TaxID=3848 RepID=A0A445H152_GLYSO|nr:hypothetical protein D0Y65_037615 [Glycine soja]